MPDEDNVWRIGFVDAPLSFKPVERRSWDHRYDDARREFGSLYCTDRSLTALREVLQDLRPNAKARAEYIDLFGSDDGLPRKAVTWTWRTRNVLAAATLSVDADDFADLGSAASRAQIERDHSTVLAEHGVGHLDVTDATRRDRRFTQALSRALFDSGAAGVRFVSNLDAGTCYALFEGRAELFPHEAFGEPTPLTEDVEELLQVCDEWGLPLEDRPDEADD